MHAEYHLSALDMPTPVSLGHYAMVAIDTRDAGSKGLTLDQWQSVVEAYLRFRALIRGAYGDCTQPGMPDGPQSPAP